PSRPKDLWDQRDSKPWALRLKQRPHGIGELQRLKTAHFQAQARIGIRWKECPLGGGSRCRSVELHRRSPRHRFHHRRDQVAGSKNCALRARKDLRVKVKGLLKIAALDQRLSAPLKVFDPILLLGNLRTLRSSALRERGQQRVPDNVSKQVICRAEVARGLRLERVQDQSSALLQGAPIELLLERSKSPSMSGNRKTARVGRQAPHRLTEVFGGRFVFHSLKGGV